MYLIEYGRILVRRGWIILLLAALAAAGAFLISRGQTPVYRSTQKILIQPSRTDFGLTEASRLLLNNLVAYLDSTFIAADIIENLRLDMTPSDLKSKVTIDSDRNSLLVQIDVDMEDEALAARVAQEWGNELVRFREQENQKVRREDQVTAQLQDNPTISLLRPRAGINALAGAVLGLLIGGVIVFVLEYLESSVVRRRDDLERALNIPVLAGIPDDLQG
ncbi:MAG: hypothetical protein JNJ61_01845 [Anaerolineae bacterium]|nr:hypothetical protein [Anaerolineae bacterium]